MKCDQMQLQQQLSFRIVADECWRYAGDVGETRRKVFIKTAMIRMIILIGNAQKMGCNIWDVRDRKANSRYAGGGPS